MSGEEAMVLSHIQAADNEGPHSGRLAFSPDFDAYTRRYLDQTLESENRAPPNSNRSYP